MRSAFLALLALASARPLPAAAVDYVRDVKPILQARCAACHGGARQKAGLRLDALSLILKGSKSNRVFVPGQAGASLLVEAVLGKDRPLGLDSRRLEIPGHKRLEIDFGKPIQPILA